MKKSDIISAYCLIRETNHSIPDDVLDFMKESAIQRLEAEEKKNNSYLNNGSCELTKQMCYSSFLNESYICENCGGHDLLINKEDK